MLLWRLFATKKDNERVLQRLMIEFEIPNAAKITVISGNTGQSIEIRDAGSIQYVTDNIYGLTYSRGEKVNSYSWSYGLTWSDENGNEVEKVTVLNEYTIIYDGRYYKGTEADYVQSLITRKEYEQKKKDILDEL